MPILGKLAIAATLEFCVLGLAAQDLAPRAYVITPLDSSAITLTHSYYTGGLQFDGAVPLTGATTYCGLPVESRSNWNFPLPRTMRPSRQMKCCSH